jgi:hypothetical protein
MEVQGGEEVWLLLIQDLGITWGCAVSFTSRPGFLPLGKVPPVSIVQEAGWASEPVWTQRLEEKSFRLCRGSNLDRPVLQSVARHSTDWATRLTNSIITKINLLILFNEIIIFTVKAIRKKQV